MTINGPAAALLAMYIAVGEQGGVAKADLAGTIQNDILKEYQAQKEYIYPPPEHADRDRHDPLHLGRDAEVAPRLDLRVPHPRSRLDRRAGTGVHPRQRVRLRRSRPRRRTGRESVRATPLVLLQRPLRLLRGDRQVPCRSPHLGPVDEGALRRHRRTGNDVPVPHPDRRCVTHRQQPENNIARVAIQALSAALGAPSRCTPTPSTKPSPSPPRRRHASRSAPSRSSPTKRVSPMWPIRSAAPPTSSG